MRDRAGRRTPGFQVGNRQMRGKTVLFACGEALDGDRAQLRRQLHARHQVFGRGDLGLRDAAIGLGNGAGQAKQGQDESA